MPITSKTKWKAQKKQLTKKNKRKTPQVYLLYTKKYKSVN